MVRRIAAALLVAGMLATVPGVGSAGPAGSVTFRGSVAAPSLLGFEDARCSWITGRAATQGAIGHMIELPPRTYDYRWFAVRAVNRPLTERSHAGLRAEGPAFQIAFYDATLGSCTNLEQPLMSFGGSANGTVGTIPGGARHALVIRTVVDQVSLPWSPCYMMPPLCITPRLGATVRASDKPGPEPFTFVIAAG